MLHIQALHDTIDKLLAGGNACPGNITMVGKGVQGGARTALISRARSHVWMLRVRTGSSARVRRNGWNDEGPRLLVHSSVADFGSGLKHALSEAGKRDRRVGKREQGNEDRCGAHPEVDGSRGEVNEIGERRRGEGKPEIGW